MEYNCHWHKTSPSSLPEQVTAEPEWCLLIKQGQDEGVCRDSHNTERGFKNNIQHGKRCNVEQLWESGRGVQDIHGCSNAGGITSGAIAPHDLLTALQG